MRSVTKSMIMCGVDQKVLYSKIFAGYAVSVYAADHVGCALTCAPYVLLARKAIPDRRPGVHAEHDDFAMGERRLDCRRCRSGAGEMAGLRYRRRRRTDESFKRRKNLLRQADAFRQIFEARVGAQIIQLRING